MALLIAIILWLLLVMLALVCLTLITPVFVKIHLTTLPQFAYRVEMHALAGLAPRLTVSGGPRNRPVANRKAKHMSKMTKPKHCKMPMRKRGHGAAVRALPTLIGGILQRIHLKKLHIDADYGLGDPAETGRLCGLLMPLQYAAPIPATVSLDLRPDFTKPRLDGSVTAAIRVTVAALLIPITRFAWRAFGPGR